MKKNLLNLSKNLGKLFLMVLVILLMRSLLNTESYESYKLLGKNIFFPRSIDIQIQIDVNKNLNEKDPIHRIIDYSGDNTKKCSFVPPGLSGKVVIDHTVFTESQLEANFSSSFKTQSGGHWKPAECEARHKVAIIVPYRDRYRHLLLFLNHMHKFLQKQQLDYAIYIIEEAQHIKFNRATLLNIGYSEAIKDYNWACFIFHDVDLVPEDDRNLYYCPFWPRHMSIAVNTLKYELPYKDIFGGVSAIKREHFEHINGFSNLYFGWGGEDDDFAERIKSHGLKIIRYPGSLARYYMLLHSKDIPSKHRFDLLGSAKERIKTDGLNSLQYVVIKKEYRRLYTWVLVSFEQKSVQ